MLKRVTPMPSSIKRLADLNKAAASEEELLLWLSLLSPPFTLPMPDVPLLWPAQLRFALLRGTSAANSGGSLLNGLRQQSSMHGHLFNGAG